MSQFIHCRNCVFFLNRLMCASGCRAPCSTSGIFTYLLCLNCSSVLTLPNSTPITNWSSLQNVLINKVSCTAFRTRDLLAEVGMLPSLRRCVHGIRVDHPLADFNVEFCGSACAGLAHAFMFWGGMLKSLSCVIACLCCFPAMLL